MSSIYVGTYGKYNCGSLDGKQFDLSDYADKEEFLEACQEFHDRNNPVDKDGDPIPAEHEFMFQDFEDIPRCFISECHIDAQFWSYMEYEDHHEGKAKAAYVALFNEWDEGKFKDAFYGQYDSDTDLAYEYVESTGMLSEVPDTVQRYFDFESFGRDLAFDFSEDDGFYFHN